MYAINIHRENAFLSGFNMNERYLRGHKPEFVFSPNVNLSALPQKKKNWNILRPQSYSMWTTVHISMTRPTIGSNWHVASDVLREI